MIFTAAQLSALPVLDTCDVLIAGGGDAQLACSGDTAARVDDEVMRLIKEAYDSALAILKQNTCTTWPNTCWKRKTSPARNSSASCRSRMKRSPPCPPAEKRRYKRTFFPPRKQAACGELFCKIWIFA